MLQHVLVTLDGSRLSEEAVEYAQNILAPGAKISLLTAVDVPEFPMYDFYPAPFSYQDKNYNSMIEEMSIKAREYLEKTALPLREAGYVVNVLVKVGEPAKTILESAEELHVDAIVISTHGRSGFSRWLFGSVTQKVLSAMYCPVFVVPGGREEAKTQSADKTAVEI